MTILPEIFGVASITQLQVVFKKQQQINPHSPLSTVTESCCLARSMQSVACA